MTSILTTRLMILVSTLQTMSLIVTPKKHKKV